MSCRRSRATNSPRWPPPVIRASFHAPAKTTRVHRVVYSPIHVVFLTLELCWSASLLVWFSCWSRSAPLKAQSPTDFALPSLPNYCPDHKCVHHLRRAHPLNGLAARGLFPCDHLGLSSLLRIHLFFSGFGQPLAQIRLELSLVSSKPNLTQPPLIHSTFNLDVAK